MLVFGLLWAVFFTFLHTIAITPFWNKDGMIIPKLIIMFTLSMYLLPIIIINFRLILSSKIAKFVVIIQCVLLLQNLIVLITSAAPLEQQIFGRTGRGLGLITTFSLAIILIATMLLVENNKKNEDKNKEKITIYHGYNEAKTTKLDLYQYFKSFNDKWIAGNAIGQRHLMDEFLFLDRSNRDIGDTAYISL